MSALKWMSMGLLLSLPLLVAAQARYNPFAGNPPTTVSNPSVSSSSSAVRTAVTRMRLKAVLPMGNPPMANIDGEIVAVGEKVHGYILRSVGEQGVTLESGGRRIQLYFKSAREEKEEAEKLAASAASGNAS